MTASVTVLGEALIDIVVTPAGEVTEHVGGSPANVAVGTARLGHATSLVTHIGTDERGKRIAGLMANEKVLLGPGSIWAHHTSTATARLDAAGAASYDFDLEWRIDATESLLRGAHLHTGSIAAVLPPGAAAVRHLIETARPNSTLSYDPNVRPSLMGELGAAREAVEGMVALADIVKASEEDLAWLYPDGSVHGVLRAWAGLGPRLCVATRGGGPVIALMAGQIHDVAVRSVPVIDTVGAGDSFMAGLISGLLDAGLVGGPDARARLYAATWQHIAPAVQRAIECAAITVGRSGANPPTRAEL